mmetsp:Transcript_6871/g.19207  ORF Transcript_6871/g.19207 Transcript_6871/m.19207 type:complete len:112 (-) Transcript_6871:71-406(-)
MNNQHFGGCTSLHTVELQGPPITKKLWPLLLEQFLREENGILAQAGIPYITYAEAEEAGDDEDEEEEEKTKYQPITIAWNFLRRNIANFYIDEKKPAYRRKRDVLPCGDNG